MNWMEAGRSSAQEQGHSSNDEVNFRKQAMRRKWRLVIVGCFFVVVVVVAETRGIIHAVSGDVAEVTAV